METPKKAKTTSKKRILSLNLAKSSLVWREDKEGVLDVGGKPQRTNPGKNSCSQVGTENTIPVIRIGVIEVKGEERYHYTNLTTHSSPRETFEGAPRLIRPGATVAKELCNSRLWFLKIVVFVSL